MLRSSESQSARVSRAGRSSRLVLGAIALAAVFIVAGTTRADLFGLGILGPKGDTATQQQQSIQDQSQEMLQELYATKPELQNVIANAVGYATFKKTDVHLLLVASGNGYGMLKNNQTGQTTYMRVASLGGGVGMGVNDLRVVFVFTDADVMETFVSQGWQFGGDADANAAYNNVGVTAGQSANANVNFADGTVDGTASTEVGAGAGNGNNAGQNVAAGNGMQIYQFTQSGIALQATVSGTKYWADPDLNNN